MARVSLFLEGAAGCAGEHAPVVQHPEECGDVECQAAEQCARGDGATGAGVGEARDARKTLDAQAAAIDCEGEA